MKPRKGWHWVKCDTCNQVYSKVTHFGGEKQHKTCKWCEDIVKECPNCFIKKEEA
jgi:hypothetical protein